MGTVRLLLLIGIGLLFLIIYYLISQYIALQHRVILLTKEIQISKQFQTILQEEKNKALDLHRIVNMQYIKAMNELKEKPVVNECSQILIDTEVNNYILQSVKKMRG